MLDWLSIPAGPLTDWAFTIVGLVLLLLAGDSLVKGAVNMSLRLGVPALIVSLTVVAFGTSAPELLIAIQAIVDGSADPDSNALKNAPHTVEDLVGEWGRPYSRENACYPAGAFRVDKYWPPVNRVDNVHGDRNLICTCPPLEDYAEAAE